MNIRVGSKIIGPGHPVYIIAEISANHGGSYQRAKNLIAKSKKAGANAVKFQVYTPETITLDCSNRHFQIRSGTLWDGMTLHDLYAKAQTPWEWLPRLQSYARALKIDFFASAFDSTAVDFLQKMKVPLHKTASFEIVDIPLIEKMARTGKPLIISTGMAKIGEISDAVSAARCVGSGQIALLKCTSAYPAPSEEMNIKTIPFLAKKFNLPIGLSDHTLTNTAVIAAVSLGACIIEKHVTLSRRIRTVDRAFSLEPDELTEMVQEIRRTEKSLGRICFGPQPHEAKSMIFRRSLFAARDIAKGDVLNLDNIRSIRPAAGLKPKYLKKILGRRARCLICEGTPIQWKQIL